MVLHRRPLADRGSPGRTHGNAVTNPRIRVCSTVVLRLCLQHCAAALYRLIPEVLHRDSPRLTKTVDHEHQSSCATTGCRTASSSTTTTSSPTAAQLGTSSSISPGRSCQSECEIGRMGLDQRPLVLVIVVSISFVDRLIIVSRRAGLMNPLCGECGFSGQLDRALKTFRERRTCGRCAIQSKHVNPRARLQWRNCGTSVIPAVR